MIKRGREGGSEVDVRRRKFLFIGNPREGKIN
jgi:hypothetical protein